MRDDLTVIYYTSNRENPLFQQKMIATLLETIGDIPLISVSHEPMNLGENICVGNLVPSTQNAFRQMQIGAMHAKTKYVCSAEADMIYPKEYFEFIPDEVNKIYKADNIYVLIALKNKRHQFHKKIAAEGAIVVGREYLIDVIDKQLNGKGKFGVTGDYDGNITPYLFDCAECLSFHNNTSIIQFKTDNNMHRKSPYIKGSNFDEVPYWGKSHDLLRKYL